MQELTWDYCIEHVLRYEKAEGCPMCKRNGLAPMPPLSEVKQALGLTPPASEVKHAPGLTLPTDSAERKEYPMFRGLIRYFPAALAGVARHSKEGNDKHNPGQEMHHARSKSADHEDCIVRHLTDLADLRAALERFALTDDQMRDMAQRILTEANALAWRALALSQELHEQLLPHIPKAPAAKE